MERQTSTESNEIILKNKKSKNGKKIALLVGIVLVLVVGILSFLLMNKDNEKEAYQTQLDLGNQYLTELDYEQAVVAFEEAIEIDPNNEEAYLALAKVHAAMGNPDAALDVLESGIEQCGSQELTQYREELEAEITALEETKEQEQAQAEEESLEAPEAITPDPIVTPEPTVTSDPIVTPEPTVTPEPIVTTEPTVTPEPTVAPEPTATPEPTEIPDVAEGWEETVYSEFGQTYRVYEYDASGRLVRETFYDPADETSLDGCLVIEYDANGNEKWLYYDVRGALDYYETHEYLNGGLEKKYTVYDADGEMLYYYLTIYDANGNIVSDFRYNPDGTLWEW